jgi:hypothetical protein
LQLMVTMAKEGQFEDLLTLLPLDFEGLLDALNSLKVAPRARLFSLQMGVHLVLTSVLLECMWNKVEHFKALSEMLSRCHQNLLLLL